MTIPSRSGEKAILRERAKGELQGLDPARGMQWSRQIVAIIGSWLDTRADIRKIALFAALPGEPDLADLPARQPNREYLYPLIGADHSLSFHLVSDPSSLRPGRFGVPEPNPQVHPPVSLREADAILCPGLAFGEDGSRLGRGKGFYDRALDMAAPGACRIGVCFSFQVHPPLPTEPHDQTMTHLLSEEGLRRLKDPLEREV